MKLLLIIIQFVLIDNNIFLSQPLYWEYMAAEQKSEYLKNPNTFSIILNYYNNDFIPTDDSLTFLILDSLTNEGEFNPLYFYLFNQILRNSDGALAEVMTEYCSLIIYNHPRELIIYFNAGVTSVDTLMNLYSLFLGVYINIDEFERLKRHLISSTKYERKEIIEKMKNFLFQIDSVRKNTLK